MKPDLPQAVRVTGLEPIRVLAAVIQRNGRFLVCRRPDHKRHGGLWEFPGGKIEAGETDFQAAERELAEELDVRVTSVGDLLLAVADPGSAFRIEFLQVEIEGNPRCIEHTELAWAVPADVVSMTLAPSDRHFAEHFVATTNDDPQ
jgi:mutator protein MutT